MFSALLIVAYIVQYVYYFVDFKRDDKSLHLKNDSDRSLVCTVDYYLCDYIYEQQASHLNVHLKHLKNLLKYFKNNNVSRE